MKAVFLRRTVCAALLAGAGVVAQAQAPRAVEQRLHEEVQAVLMRLVESGELAARDAEALSLSAPVSQQVDFGAILDVRHRAGADTGLPVLAVTPGGSADRIGLRAGDQVLAVGEVELRGLGADAHGRARAAQRLREELVASAEDVELRVLRDGVETRLRGPVRLVQLPAYRLDLGAALATTSLAAATGGDATSSCGRVSIFDIAPRSQHLYRAVLIGIDGELPGPSSAESFRLEPGPHRLTIGEAIDHKQFDAIALRQRDGRQRDRYKELGIMVQPGVTYRIAARLVPDKRNSIRDGAYWEPVVWKESAEPCR